MDFLVAHHSCNTLLRDGTTAWPGVPIYISLVCDSSIILYIWYIHSYNDEYMIYETKECNIPNNVQAIYEEWIYFLPQASWYMSCSIPIVVNTTGIVWVHWQILTF